MINFCEFELKLCIWLIMEIEENVLKFYFYVIIEIKKIKNILKIVLDMGWKYCLINVVSYKRM